MLPIDTWDGAFAAAKATSPTSTFEAVNYWSMYLKVFDAAKADSDLTDEQYSTKLDAALSAVGLEDYVKALREPPVFGTSAADKLAGEPAGSVFSGGPGADSMAGGAGNDLYLLKAGDGQDRISDSDGTDAIVLAAGIAPASVRLVGESGRTLWINYGAGADRVGIDYQFSATFPNNQVEQLRFADGTPWALTGNLTFTGTEANDTVTGGPGADQVLGRGGNDTLSGYASDDTVLGESGNDRLNGNSGNDALNGGDGDDNLTGDDSYSGDPSGNDTLDGGTGADSMAGGAGNDIYYVDDTGDRVSERASEGTDEVRSLLTYKLGANVENLTLIGTAAINGTGNELNNVIVGNAANNVLDGGGGFDAAFFSGVVAAYHFAENGAQVTVSGPEGTDTLKNIEQLSLGNVSFSIADRSHFNPLYYLEHNPDVAAAAIDPFTHYRSAGWAEGRDPNPSLHLASVDGLEYIASYGDLMAAFGANKAAGYQHFATAGLFEGRTTTFDGLEYIASYGDLIQAFGPNVDAGASHYIVAGRTEGRHVTFDGLEYIASYDDLIGAFHNQVAANRDPDIGAIHFITAGYAEQREPDRFDAASYLDHYADLQAAFHGDLHAATVHYITQGYFEGRTDHHSA